MCYVRCETAKFLMTLGVREPGEWLVIVWTGCDETTLIYQRSPAG